MAQASVSTGARSHLLLPPAALVHPCTSQTRQHSKAEFQTQPLGTGRFFIPGCVAAGSCGNGWIHAQRALPATKNATVASARDYETGSSHSLGAGYEIRIIAIWVTHRVGKSGKSAPAQRRPKATAPAWSANAQLAVVYESACRARSVKPLRLPERFLYTAASILLSPNPRLETNVGRDP
jgi:hypothetical protein